MVSGCRQVGVSRQRYLRGDDAVEYPVFVDCSKHRKRRSKASSKVTPPPLSLRRLSAMAVADADRYIVLSALRRRVQPRSLTATKNAKRQNRCHALQVG